VEPPDTFAPYTHLRMRTLAAVIILALTPAIAWGQASITGVIRDTSGGVLPGVTVEASSSALIERVRVVVSDGSGQYRIVDLRPGQYAVTFSLPGFNTVKREGIELTGSFTATVDVELPVGALDETITVTREAPIVDVQSTLQQRVMSKDVLDTLPTGRRVYDAGVLIPGVATNQIDVGGTAGPGVNTNLTVHGSRQQDQRITIGGLAVTNLDGQGGFSAYNPNLGSSQEVTFDTSGASAENSQGGVTINIIPKEGGNRYSGTLFATGTTSGLQGSNFDDDLKNRGFSTPNRIKDLYDVNPGFGGPLKRDALWLYASGRWQETSNYVGGMYSNANLGKTTLPEAWLYAPDLGQQAWARQFTRSVNGRVTWQATAKDKFSGFWDSQSKCATCPGGTPTASPETSGTGGTVWPVERFASASWSSPRTNRLLFEASVGNRDEEWEGNKLDGADRTAIPVLEQSTAITYHGLRAVNGAIFSHFTSTNWTARGSVSYVTGSHALKFGMSNLWGHRILHQEDNIPGVQYRFNNGIPNLITQRATPYDVDGYLRADMGMFAQDRWTIGRLTTNAGLRYDWFNSYFPDQHLGPATWIPNRNLDLPRNTLINWNDMSPRLGAAYDLLGDGKTALKVSLNRYVLGNALQATFGDGANPVSRLANSVTRSWTDMNGNFTPDCSLQSVDANGECGPMSDRRFGQPIPSLTYDQATLKGFGARGYNWEFSAGAQRELTSMVSANVGYFRRWYGNQVIVDNRATTAADYTRFSVAVPGSGLLPGGGGSTLAGFYDLNPNKVGQVDNYLTFASNYGTQTEYWHGADVSVNVRNWLGMLLQGGISTGRTVVDNCDVDAKVPEMLNQVQGPFGFGAIPQPSDTWCHTAAAWLTQVKLLGSYLVPKLGLQTSATFQSLPGPEVSASYVATNGVVAPSLGRPLSASAVSTTLQLVQPGTTFGERLNQLDLRIGRKVRVGQLQTALNLDVYNVTNGNPVLTENPSFAVFRRPTSVLPARFAKISLQVDF